jgi:hypothetical protein
MTAILPILPNVPILRNLPSLPIRTSPPYGLSLMTDLPDTAPAATPEIAGCRTGRKGNCGDDVPRQDMGYR